MQSLTISRVIIFIFFSFILTACGGGDEVTVNPNDPVEPEPSKL